MKWSILPARLHGVLEGASVLAFLIGPCGTTFATAPAGAPDSQKAKTLFQNKMRRLVTVPKVPEQRSESESTHHLRSAEVQEQSSANLAQAIAGGKNNMPSCASSLTKEQTDALVKYVRGFASSK
jgi:hypothetical protein